MGRHTRTAAAILGLVLLLAGPTAEAARNVIVMVPDGCSWSLQTLARWYKGKPLALDGVLVGAVRTNMADSVITDSAAAATAFACGQKTSDGFEALGPRAEGVLSIYPPPAETLRYKPLATVLEGARLRGMATGVVVTSRVADATPAAFVSHTDSRTHEDDIAEQLVYQGIDVVLGGGRQHLLPVTAGGTRSDGENLLDVLRQRGYRIVQTSTELAAVTHGRVFGALAPKNMAPDLDRVAFKLTEPSLAEMTRKAIEILSQDRNGFFLFVEGSQVDLGGHANDAVMAVTELLAFDGAVAAALEFAERDGNTLVLAFPDHATGGVSIGNANSNYTYTKTSVESLLAPLQRMQLTSLGVASEIGTDLSPANIESKVTHWWGIEPSNDEIAAILARVSAGFTLDYAIAGLLVQAHTLVGFTSLGHEGGDVPLWAFGPGAPAGSHDNTELARLVAGALGVDLGAVNRRLFVDITTTFPETVIDSTDPTNPVVKVGACRLPVGKNLLIHGPSSRVFPLDGVVVWTPATGKAYAPESAVALIKILRVLGGWHTASTLPILAGHLDIGGAPNATPAQEPLR
jgi:alkaline phosphatase